MVVLVFVLVAGCGVWRPVWRAAPPPATEAEISRIVRETDALLLREETGPPVRVEEFQDVQLQLLERYTALMARASDAQRATLEPARMRLERGCVKQQCWSAGGGGHTDSGCTCGWRE